VPFLCEAVRQPRFVLGVEPPVSVERRCRAAQLLGELNAKEAEFALDAGLREENVETRIASAIALAQLGVLAREVVSQLVAGLDDPDLIVRKSCQEALQKAGAKAISLLADAANGQVIHLGPQNEVCLTLNARLVAIKILGSIPHVSAIYCLVNQLKDPHEIIRYRTVVALEKFNDRKVRAALEHVVRNDLSRRVKMRAREALQFVLEQNHLSGADKLSS
jgi:HEAT repeat protein